MKKWRKISTKVVYQNPWIKVYEDKVYQPDGKKSVYGYLVKPVGVFALPVDKDGSVYLIRQYRYPLKKYIYEIPAGVVDGKGSALSNAKRELKEETGISAKKWHKLGAFFTAPGHETTKIVAYLATELNVTECNCSHQEGDEMISKIIKVERNELFKMVEQGKIECGITLAVLGLWQAYLKLL